MKTSQALIILIVLLLIGSLALAWIKNKTKINNPSINQNSSLIGCYIATISKDVYTLNIQTINGNKVTGILNFDNFEKDSSSGTFNGTYKDGILLGDYSFSSEGMDSMMQVNFKKSGDNFIRGMGELNSDGTRFASVDNIIYDETSPLFVFKKGECLGPNINRITLTGEYICLPHVDTSGPQTLECALGLHADNGYYYALNFNLSSQSLPNLKTGDKISAGGVFTPVETLNTDQWQKYPIIGIFSVTDSLIKL